MTEYFCSCLGVIPAQGYFRARETSWGPFPAQLCTQIIPGMWGNNALVPSSRFCSSPGQAAWLHLELRELRSGKTLAGQILSHDQNSAGLSPQMSCRVGCPGGLFQSGLQRSRQRQNQKNSVMSLWLFPSACCRCQQCGSRISRVGKVKVQR